MLLDRRGRRDTARRIIRAVLFGTWDKVLGLGSVVAGQAPGRTSAQGITLFKSLGIAIEDVALSIRACEKAIKQGLGQPLPNLAG